MADTVWRKTYFSHPLTMRIYFLNGKRFLLEINGIGPIAVYSSARLRSGHQTVAKVFYTFIK